MSTLRRYEILLPLRFNDAKEQVKTDFQQVDIWLTSYPIDVL